MDEDLTLLDRFFRRGETAPAASIFVMLGFLGLAAVGAWVGHVKDLPWHLDRAAPVVAAIGSECAPFTGGRFFIEVEGQQFVCTGSDNKCGFEGAVDIAFDPADPKLCRVASHVDDLSRYEQLLLLASSAFVLIGLSGGAYMLSEHMRRRDLVDDPPRRQVARSRLRSATKICLALAAVAINLAGLVVWLGM